VLAALGALGARLALRLAVVGLAIGALDFLIARGRHLRALRMTREEAERDRRETEGDPARRAQRRRLHREQLMLEDVRRADVVLESNDAAANGHLAVALRYAPALAPAPVVIARGDRLAARRLVEAARAARVPVLSGVERAPLVRSLADLGVGGETPPALYEAVAEILREVRAQEP
jgi:flagellar biosynthesis protein FlhB